MRRIALILGAVLLVAGAGFGANYLLRDKASQVNTSDSSDDQRETINYDPPTEEETRSGDDEKNRIVEEEKDRAANPGAAADARVVITYASQYDGRNVEVGGFVSNKFEDGGRCTLVLKKDGVTQTATVNAVKAAQSTDCPMMSVSRDKLTPGTWQAVVEYQSASSTGNSGAAKAIEVK